ncbi:hypothetical protein AG1IA_04191 [Rhizoctonia solani AG-1 IA]|uniref:Uncharacterized protein n=1 Tax=Thanatephorus cucumeris (strain AG1-IA) TaxID=983506 RepID=L8WUJ8_THACA|nr:hypothetical protein AG1IA_04191 [Rhizoctonia solani AG-1 IA]
MQACILPLQTQFGLFTIALLDLLSSRQPVLAGTTCPSAREFIDVDQHIETGAPPSEEAIADEIRQSYEHILRARWLYAEWILPKRRLADLSEWRHHAQGRRRKSVSRGRKNLSQQNVHDI